MLYNYSANSGKEFGARFRFLDLCTRYSKIILYNKIKIYYGIFIIYTYSIFSNLFF